MFTRLRNRFLLLNLALISFMMLIAFTTIYLITYNNVRTGIAGELSRISDFNRRSVISEQLKPAPDGSPQQERSVSFVVTTDKQWNTTVISSIFDMDNKFYETAKSSALSEKTSIGNFKLDGSYWAFMIKPVSDGYRIIFLDITSQRGILTNLIYTFLIVACVMLVFILFISRFFANRAIRPVKEAFDKQKQFVADASHELKTPLTVINTNVDVLLSNGEDNINEQSKWLYYIKSEVERMTKLTNDLLYLAQLDYSDLKMIYTRFDLSDAVENILLTMEAVFFENNISFSSDIEPGLMVRGNSEQLRQVAMILLDNAVKYTNTKGSVRMELKKSGSGLILSVANTGEGVAAEQLGKIFDRFYRTDKSRARKSGGYGLGLSIAKTIVEQHGGKIYAKSTLNEKTVFIIELPLGNH